MYKQNFLNLLVDIAPYIAVSAVCGVYAALKRGIITLREFILSLLGSSLCGGIVGWGLMSMDINAYGVGAMCGIAGLMGDRGLHMLEKALIRKFNRVLDKTFDPPQESQQTPQEASETTE